MRRCPGSRKDQKCVVHQDERPRNVTDALGQQLSAEGYADLLHAWRKQNPKAAASEAQARREARGDNRSVRFAEDDQSPPSEESADCEDCDIMATSKDAGCYDSDEAHYMGVVWSTTDVLFNE